MVGIIALEDMLTMYCFTHIQFVDKLDIKTLSYTLFIAYYVFALIVSGKKKSVLEAYNDHSGPQI